MGQKQTLQAIEKQLAIAILRDPGFEFGEKDKAQENCYFHYTYLLWREMDISDKIALHILKKWSKRKWYDYSLTIRVGWLMPTGLIALRKIASS